MVIAIGNGVAFATAPVDGVEGFPATELPHGVNQGFLFLSPPPGSSAPGGFFTVRASGRR